MYGKLKKYFNKRPRIGTLSTANNEGKANVAFFSSPMMIEEKTVIMGLGRNRTFANLQENPYAAYMIVEPGETTSNWGDWRGVRVYLKMVQCDTSSEKLSDMRLEMVKVAGESAAKMLHAAVTFEIQDVRPLVDFGQGWEQSINV